MNPLKLYYTPLSHFARKVRILMAALDLPVTLIDAGNVAQTDQRHFGPNPLQKVPTLVDGQCTVFESDHIAQYLVQKHDPSDGFSVMTRDVQAMNARAVMNGIMSAEVELILALRTGINIEGLARFDKLKSTILQGLQWLDDHQKLFGPKPSYLAFHLVAAWDHLVHSQLVTLNHPQLASKVEVYSTLPYVQASAPNPV